MKLSTYTPQVNRNTINARVQAPGSLQSYGADQSGAMGTSRMLGGLAQMSQRIMIDDDKRTLLEAMDAYNKGRYNILYGDNGLMKTNLEGAAGISQRYTEQEQKLRSDVLKNINFKTRDYELAFGITHNYKTVLEILENNTNLDFITCDSPVINLTGKDFKNPTVFYYPITPKIAIKLKIYDLFYDINNDINNKVIIINDDNVNEIIELNKIVFKNSYNEIYSNNEETLKSFLCSQH